MVRIILAFFVINAILGCNKDDNPNKYSCLKEDMTYWGHYVNTSNLKLNGFYYGEKDTSKLSPHGTLIILLYNTGIIYFSGVKSNDKMEIRNELLNNEIFRESDAIWGAFNIVNNEIKFQMLSPISDRPFRKCVPVTLGFGRLQNDSSFTVNYTGSFWFNTSFEFVKLDSKPDSTNLFFNILGAP